MEFRGWYHVMLQTKGAVLKDKGVIFPVLLAFLTAVIMFLLQAQSIKNFTSERWQRLLNFSNHQQRLLLMRSPLSNSATELWSLMHFLFPSMHQFSTEFKAAFTESSWETNDTIVSDLRRVSNSLL